MRRISGISRRRSWFTGPSSNGRSSAFGALCLGSNPSGPARKAVVGRWLLVVRQPNDASANNERPTTNDQRPTTNDQRPTTNDQRYNGYSCYSNGKENNR